MAEYWADAAQLWYVYGIKPPTLRSWARRNRIQTKLVGGRTLYDVNRAEILAGRTATPGQSRPGGCGFCELPAMPGCPVPLCSAHLAAVVDFAGSLANR